MLRTLILIVPYLTHILAALAMREPHQSIQPPAINHSWPLTPSSPRGRTTH